MYVQDLVKSCHVLIFLLSLRERKICFIQGRFQFKNNVQKNVNRVQASVSN